MIKIDMTIRNANIGAIIKPTRRIIGGFASLGDYAVLEADGRTQTQTQTQTQKARIATHQTSLFFQELTGLTMN